MANEAVMGIVATFQDEASAGLRRTSRNVQTFGREFRQATNAVGRLGQAMTNILLLTNLLPGNMSKAINTTLLLATTTVNAVFAITQLVQAYQTLKNSQTLFIALERARAIATAIANAVATKGLSLLLIPAALAGGVAVGTMIDRAMSQGARGSAAQPEGNTTIINNGVMMGNEADARRLARQIQEINRSDERLGR